MAQPAATAYLGLSAVEDKLLKGFLAEAGDELEKTMGMSMKEMNEKDEYFVLRLQRVTDIHLFSHLKYENSQNVNIQTLMIIAGISILIILIACINYANLSTARLAGRVREIGIRKILGSQRAELSRQLLAESITISFISLFFALVIVELIWLPPPVFLPYSFSLSLSLSVVVIDLPSPSRCIDRIPITNTTTASLTTTTIYNFTPDYRTVDVSGHGFSIVLRACSVLLELLQKSSSLRELLAASGTASTSGSEKHFFVS